MRLLAPALVLLIVAAGCGHVVVGAAQPAATAVTVLPSEAEITDAVGNGLSTFDFRPFVGGSEIMPDGFHDDADATPFRCIGVTETMLRATYEGADVIEAARQSYFTLAPGARVSGADAAVVRFGSESEAVDRYRAFTERWRGCDGQTVVKHLRGTTDTDTDVDAAIDDVDADDPLLTATVVTRQGANAPEQIYLRAVALRDDTLVEVSLAVADRTGSDGAAARVARVMLDKVGAQR